MNFIVPKVSDAQKMFSRIDSALVNKTGGCPCRCTACNSCSCGRCYALDETIEIDIWD